MKSFMFLRFRSMRMLSLVPAVCVVLSAAVAVGGVHGHVVNVDLNGIVADRC